MTVSVRPAVTLDGFIADKNGECYSWINPKDEARFNADLQTCGFELVGRKTYEQYKNSYDARTKIMTFVYTRMPQKDLEMVKFVSGDLAKVLQKIENDYGIKEIMVSGEGALNGSLAVAGLIDDLYISYHPVILGEGIRVFGNSNISLRLTLLGSDTNVPGVVRNHYKVLK